MKKREDQNIDETKKAPKRELPRPLFDHCGRINVPSFDPGDLLDMKKTPWPDEL